MKTSAASDQVTQKWVECVPNFSAGQNKQTVERLVKAIGNVKGARLLHVHRGSSTNRSVFTLVGSPEGICNVAFKAIQEASELIDMRDHLGVHPRMGACDVCPFVPLKNVSFDECIEIAKQLGSRVGSELDIPVFLYEKAASKPYRQSLAAVRRGEYEGLEEKLQQPEWQPDFGPHHPNERSGATAIGVRGLLIAYNVNLETKDEKVAKQIARNIRDSGPVDRPNRLQQVKAIGWFIKEYNCAQVSMNVMDYKVSTLMSIFTTICEEAKSLGTRVTGSEIFGMVPKDALTATEGNYLETLQLKHFNPKDQILDIATL